MPLTQGLYLEGSVDLREGEIVMDGILTDTLTGSNGAGVILPFGRAVIYAAGATGVNERAILTLPTAAAQVIRGVAVATDTIERQPGVTVDGNGNLGYPASGSVTVDFPSFVTRGMIAVRAVEAVLKGDAVTTVITVGATQGAFGKTANASQIACPASWEWATTTSANGIGIIWLK